MADRPPNDVLEAMLADDVPEGSRVVSVGVTARFRVVERTPKGPWLVQHVELVRALGRQVKGHAWKTILICNADIFEGIAALMNEQVAWQQKLRERGSLRSRK
jgi:hypothetical protein